MSWKHLGEVFDIHGGGIDLVFPHHENELAQTRMAFGHPLMANIWMHNGFLQVEGRKMAKSEGNFITIQELLRDWPGEVLRFNMLRTHYRQPIDWTLSGLDESWKTLDTWSAASGLMKGQTEGLDGSILEALLDDMNTPLAIAELHKRDAAEIAPMLRALGFSGKLDSPKLATIDSSKVDNLIAARLTARRSKNWGESDRIRDELAAMGVVLKDNKDGTTIWEVKR
jgi:cysteinyl-tRNA synthetase